MEGQVLGYPFVKIHLADPADPANGGGIFDGHEFTDFMTSESHSARG